MQVFFFFLHDIQSYPYSLSRQLKSILLVVFCGTPKISILFDSFTIFEAQVMPEQNVTWHTQESKKLKNLELEKKRVQDKEDNESKTKKKTNHSSQERTKINSLRCILWE